MPLPPPARANARRAGGRFQTASKPDCGSGRCKQTRPHLVVPHPAIRGGCNNTDTPALPLSDGPKPPHTHHSGGFDIPPRRPTRNRTPPACAKYRLLPPASRAAGPNPPSAAATARRRHAHPHTKPTRSAANRCAAARSGWAQNVRYSSYPSTLHAQVSPIGIPTQNQVSSLKNKAAIPIRPI